MSLILIVSLLPAQASAEVLSGALSSTLGREPQLRPGALGDGALEGLQYADPTEGLALVEPPEPGNQGSAALTHPLHIPAGRGGVQPDLNIEYDSGGGNGWVGNGWDLTVGEIGVDTRWGVPRYLADVESEGYLLDGEVLSPTAVRSELLPRVARRDDFTRRVDTSYEHIVRHGDSPRNYFWVVTDKLGAKRWYGAVPDCGGPDGWEENKPDLDNAATPAETEPVPDLHRDASAILADGQGNGYRWALSASRDVGGNLIRYFYETATVQPWGSDGPAGKQLYLDRIRYTGWASGRCVTDPEDPKYDPDNISEQLGIPEDPAYEVRFLRDQDLEPRPPAARKDPVVSARGGLLEVTGDLLRRVEVYHGKPTAETVQRKDRTEYTELSRRYDLNYTEGAFGKTLLTSVDQVGSDKKVYATNRFDYYDEVRSGGTYDGFADTQEWASGDDGLDQTLLSPVGTSVLGASETNSGDVHAYLGFNPAIGTKDGSFGGALSVSGGATEALAEFLDLNGDLLPDKVFRKTRGGDVMYRLNVSGPDGPERFADDAYPVSNLNRLSTEFNVGVAGGPEAYAKVAVQFSVGGAVTVGEDYFTDVNNDGLADFVSAEKVRFNHLENVGGRLVPTFTDDSSKTAVPIDDASVDLPALQAIADAEARQRAQSPLQDTVRRWVAPYTGTISIDAPVTYAPPALTSSPTSPPANEDGVRATIQSGDIELWAGSLVTPGQTGTPTGVGAVPVVRGQAVYFRLQSVNNGFRDRVRWDPTIEYTSFTPEVDGPALDVNGLSQSRFQASDDFTLAGRPSTKIFMPLQGRVRFDATLRKTATTSDDVRVLVLKNGIPVIDQLVTGATVSTDGIDVSGEFDIAAPEVDGADEIEVRLAVDSPIDVTALDWNPRLYYLEATRDGQPVDVVDELGRPTIESVVPADVDIYPQNTLQAPSRPSGAGGSGTLTASYLALGAHAGGDVVLTVKRRGALVAKGVFAPGETTLELPVSLAGGTDYWFDLTVRDNLCPVDAGGCRPLSERITESAVELGGVPVPSTRHWAGGQGIFPLPYRGWGLAGYNGDGDRAAAPLDQQAFEIDPDAFSTRDPEGFDDPSYRDPVDGGSFAFTPFQHTLRDADGNIITNEPQWRGMKENISGGADVMQSSRRGLDDPEVVDPAGAGQRAIRRIGITAPTLSLAGSVAGAGGSFAVGTSFGLLDYVDMNGDSFPDVVAPGYIQYTGPRGGYVDDGGGIPTVGQDVTFGGGGGFNGSAVDVKANSRGDANTSQNSSSSSRRGNRSTKGGAAGQGSPASRDVYGASIGLGVGVTASFTNPITNPNAGAIDTAPLEQELADVNGDGLPDRIEVDPDGIRVYFNLGYGFVSEAAEWSGGGFESGEEFSGSVSPGLGFQINNKEFAGGLSLTEAVDISRYSWVDVDGDGVLDRLRKDGRKIQVAFGSGAGILPEVVYGDLAEAAYELPIVPGGDQVAAGVTRGVGAGVDFTIGIGPLCVRACYLIVNPGIHFDHSVSNTNVQLSDVDGDGYPDSVRSDSDDDFDVRRNKRGRTNLLRSVTNPLGGQIRLGYERDGNSVEQPFSQWLLSSVEVDDKRPGDGPDTTVSTYDYTGNRYNPLEREVLGFAQVTERQRRYAGDGNVLDDDLLRSVERTYRNATVFDNGLSTSERLLGPDGTPLKETRTTWSLRDLRTGQPADLGPSAADPAGLRLLEMAVGPLVSEVEHFWYDGSGGTGQQTAFRFGYTDPVAAEAAVPWHELSRGNVLRQTDLGELELGSDDVVADTTYTDCRVRDDAPSLDYTWVSVPDTLVVRAADGTVLRSRDGSKHNLVDYDDMGDEAPGDDDDPGTPCDNQSLTRLDQGITGELSGSQGARETSSCGALADPLSCASTELVYDEWGSYAQITYPANVDGDRLEVKYVYDSDRHSDIARTEDSHGLVSTATFDGLTGRISSRTDANRQTTSYTYDAIGRIASITGPYEQGADRATVTFEYFPSAAGYAYAVARHFDVFNPDDTIDTATFVDGIGRQTQTKHDGSAFRGATAVAEDVMIVSGAVEFDDFGRQVKQFYPSEQNLGAIGTFAPRTLPAPVRPTVTEYDLRDQVTKVTEPNLATTATSYRFEGQTDFGARLFETTVTDPEGKPTRTYSDVRGQVLAFDDLPNGAPRMRTRYAYDALGQLLKVTDSAGNITTHTYDLLGRRTSTRTPDSGLVERRWDAADNLISEVDENQRARGAAIRYDYDVERLVGIDYPDATPDVTYTFGAADAPGNGAGRIVGVQDGARTQTLGYDPLGQVTSEVATMAVHNLDGNEQRSTYTTTFAYDAFGRMRSMVYPDGESLTNGYDSGGLLSAVSGAKACTLAGTLANAVSATDTTVTVTESPHSDSPAVPFAFTIGGEQMTVTARTATAEPGRFDYTVVRGVNSTPELDTSAPHAAGVEVSTDVQVTCTYRYLDRREYDEFSDRRFQQSGNDVRTEYGYDAETRWLARQVTDTPVREVQDLNYTYDKVGNVVRLDNQLPAPTPELKGGPSTQNYRYDPYYRLKSADGVFFSAPDTRRDYTFALNYDTHGNIVSKKQTDIVTVPGGKRLTQAPTTYTIRSIEYGSARPHQITRIDRRPYTHDPNGNFTGWTDDRTGQSRTVTWDAENRMRSAANQGSTTRYSYDESGALGIERGPAGETAFVNRWYTVRNGSVAWKHIWAGDDRIAEQRAFDDGSYEHMRFWLHKDLQGSTNIVTDDRALVFQHLEYFPGGEQWVAEQSTLHRTPYLYTGGYLDEVRQLLNLGERWYEPREQFLYSPDPALLDSPDQVVASPALLPAYSYAESNPLRLVDPTGRTSQATRAQLNTTFSKVRTVSSASANQAWTSFKDFGRITPGSPASRRLTGGWGAGLGDPNSNTRAAKTYRALFGQIEAPPLLEVKLSLSGGLKLKSVSVLGKKFKPSASGPAGGAATTPAGTVVAPVNAPALGAAPPAAPASGVAATAPMGTQSVQAPVRQTRPRRATVP